MASFVVQQKVLTEIFGFQVKQLKEDVQSVCVDGDHGAPEKALELELERMQTSIGCLTEERDQLQEILQGLREEKSQLKGELEEKDELVRNARLSDHCVL